MFSMLALSSCIHYVQCRYMYIHPWLTCVILQFGCLKYVCLVHVYTTFLLQDEGVPLVEGYMRISIQNRKYANAYELMYVVVDNAPRGGTFVLLWVDYCFCCELSVSSSPFVHPREAGVVSRRINMLIKWVDTWDKLTSFIASVVELGGFEHCSPCLKLSHSF